VERRDGEPHRLISVSELIDQFRGAVHGVEQRSDVRFGTSKRLEGGDTDQRFTAEIEDDRIPARGRDIGPESA
jgi:hypothetical protein